MPHRTPIAAGPRAGFSLLELLAVMVVLGILAAFLIPNLLTGQEAVEVQTTRAKMGQIVLAVDAYEREYGSYPPSSFLAEWGAPPNDTNTGIECLVLALWSKGYEAGGLLSADELVNTDADRSAGSVSDLPTSELLEIVDVWENPIAYIQSGDYGKEHRYLSLDPDGFEGESIVNALRSDTTGRYVAHAKYQLISAGPDGVFGTEDDVTNAER